MSTSKHFTSKPKDTKSNDKCSFVLVDIVGRIRFSWVVCCKIMQHLLELRKFLVVQLLELLHLTPQLLVLLHIPRAGFPLLSQSMSAKQLFIRHSSCGKSSNESS